MNHNGWMISLTANPPADASHILKHDSLTLPCKRTTVSVYGLVNNPDAISQPNEMLANSNIN